MKNILRIIFTLFFSLTFFACNQNSDIRPNAKNILTEKESYEIMNSIEMIKFNNIRNDFLKIIKRSIKNGIDINLIHNLSIASLNDKTKELELINLLFVNQKEATSFIDDYSKIEMNLINKYPIFREFNNENNPDLNSSIDFLFNNFDNLYKSKVELKNNIANKVDPNVPICGSYWQQVKLGICATACSFSTAGVATPLCGWACWCTLCKENSDLADIMC